jgi:glycosyltransferase involved in cell wall biosynthesis
MKISIVSAYFNRRDLLINTLNTIKKTSHNDFEYIVVDDCSDDEHRIEDLCNEYDFLKVIRLERENKWYVNPCIPFNIGFTHISGDLVIIQNPECLHVGDILSYVNQHLTDDNYLNFSCYSANLETTNKFKTLDLSVEVIHNEVVFEDRSVLSDGDCGWYNHPSFRPVGYHFASAITNSNLKLMGGFDERYATGIGYDDDEFLRRIRRSNMRFDYCSEPFVIHQNHYNIVNNHKIENASMLVQKNKSLFHTNK